MPELREFRSEGAVTLKLWEGVTLNNTSDYRTNRLYRTHNPNLVC